MASHEIDYPDLVNQALRGVARRVLESVAVEGLPGEHHFFITLSTDHPDLELPMALRRAHPEEMTIVLQNQFWDLVVEEDAFAVTLRFDGQPQRLRIPWPAVKSFVDPAAEVGLRFESEPLGEDESDSQRPTSDLPTEPGEVVSLDEFRNRDS